MEKENDDLAAARIAAVCAGARARQRHNAGTRLRALSEGHLARCEVGALRDDLWVHNEMVLLAILRWMAEVEDIRKVLLNQLDVQADFLFPERKLRYAGSLRNSLAPCQEKGLVVTGGKEPKQWVSLASEIDLESLPKVPTNPFDASEPNPDLAVGSGDIYLWSD